MLGLIRNFIDTFRPVHTGEEGQDTFEYLLIVGVLVVAIIAAVIGFPGLISTVLTEVEAAITGLFA